MENRFVPEFDPGWNHKDDHTFEGVGQVRASESAPEGVNRCKRIIARGGLDMIEGMTGAAWRRNLRSDNIDWRRQAASPRGRLGNTGKAGGSGRCPFVV